MRQTKRSLSAGFTLIEVMIIAPVVILVVSGFVGLMISMVGDSLVTREQNNMTYETQDALDRIEQDTRLTTQFLVTSSNQTAPQGSDGNFTGSAAFTSTNTLILGGLTTDKNPTDSTRQLVYYANQPNDCGTQQTYNRIFQGKTMYFIKDGSLWRRSVIPDYNLNATVDDSTTCSAPWQRNTCSPGYSVATRCQTNDSEVMKNIDTFTVKYLSAPDSVTDLGSSQALTANAIEVAITGKKTSKGRAVTSSGTIRATKLNNVDVDLPLPTTPAVSASVNGTTVAFSWATVPSATSYVISYNINGGSWINATTDNRTTTYTVNANRNDTVSIRVSAKNSTGTSPYGSAAGTIPAWYSCLGANWQDYGGTYAGNGYTKTSDDVVMLRGLIKSGTTTAGTVLCTLPPAYRPSARLMFQTATAGSSDTASRIDVLPTGEVYLDTVSSGWLSLNGINFMATTSPHTWTALPRSNGWQNYANGYSDIQSTIDTTGRVHVQGLIRLGTYADPTTAATLPVGARPDKFFTVPARSPTYNNTAIGSDGTISAKGINGSTFFSIQSMFYSSSYLPSFTGWNSIAPLAGWVNFDTANWSSPQYTKSADGIVTVRGMLKNGTTTGGTIIGSLLPGYRPAATLLFHVASSSQYGRVDVQADGKIVLITGYAPWLSLDSISFMAEQ